MTTLDTPPTAHGPLAETLARIEQTATARGRLQLDGDDGPCTDAEILLARTQGIDAWRAQRWASIVTQRYQFASLADLAGPWADRIVEWATVRPRVNLVVFGPTGAGKTHAGIAACRPAHDLGLEVQFWPVGDLVEALKPGGPVGAFESFVDSDRLIVDDLGSERPTDFAADRMYALVNRRWLNESPTVFTTNLTPPALRGVVGDRMFSRIMGSGACVVDMTGIDRRRG